MTRTHRRPARTWGAILFFTTVYLSQSGYDSCSGDLLDDSGFDIWCGDALCSWQVERGGVRKAPTWHEEDVGVELVGDDVLLGQKADVDASNALCVRFELVADIAQDATVTMTMDLFGDQETEYERQLPTAPWTRLVYMVRMPLQYQGIVFHLHKRGPGRAVLAQIRARSVDESECSGATRLDDLPVPLGGSCYAWTEPEPLAPVGEVCESGICAPTTPGEAFPHACGECADDGDCGPEEVCGVVSRVADFLDPYRACVAPAAHVPGERCFADAECSTGVCCLGRCSACCAAEGRECPDGRACREVVVEELLGVGDHCAPGEGLGAAGATCLTDGDCASGACDGSDELRVCTYDGRRCESDTDCPAAGSDPWNGSSGGPCVTIGIAGGSCR